MRSVTFFLFVFLMSTPAIINAQLQPLKGITLLIDFEDLPADLSDERIDNLINGEGYTEDGVPSSIRDYWQNQSRDSIDLTYDIFGHFRAPLTFAEYELMDWTLVNDLVTDALDSVVAQNPDYNWDELSTHSSPGLEGALLSVNVITTGWVPGAGGSHWSTDWVAPNGYYLHGFSVQPLTSSWDPEFIYLFVMAHEVGHAAWGFPDTYDYDGSSFGTGFYSLMSGNQLGGEIESIGAPFYLDANWANPIDMEPNTFYTLKQDGKFIARYLNPSDPNEYFLIEACMKSTPGNAAFPVERGLVIWHIDENVTTNNTLENRTYDEHYAYSIEQADGYFDLENHINQGDEGDIYVEGDHFSSVSMPNSNWWNDETSELDINNIEFLPDNSIRFCNGDCGHAGIETSETQSIFTYPNINNGHFWINFSEITLDDNLFLEIISPSGVLIETREISSNKNEKLEVQLATDYSGFVFIRISNSSQESLFTGRMVIQQ